MPDASTPRLSGDFTLPHLAEAGAPLQAALEGEQITIDASQLEQLDTAGALWLEEARRKAAQRGASLKVTGLAKAHLAVLELVSEALPEQPAPTPKPLNWLVRLGKHTCETGRAAREMLAFLGEMSLAAFRVVANPTRFRLATLCRHVFETGIMAMPIVALVAFLIAIVLAYQGAFQLRNLGAQQLTINLVAISVLREMGVLLTAIMVAGRSGSAFTAEIGMMQLNQEVDALRMMGVAPFESLVLPRLWALLITLPLLTLLADVVGLAGGAVICVLQLKIPLLQYLSTIQDPHRAHDFWIGLVKAPFFAILIAVVGCRHGMAVSGNAESLGRNTTAAVVESIFLTLITDAGFSVVFANWGL